MYKVVFYKRAIKQLKKISHPPDMETTFDISQVKKGVLESFTAIARELSLEKIEDIQNYLEVIMIEKTHDGETIPFEQVIEEINVEEEKRII